MFIPDADRRRRRPPPSWHAALRVGTHLAWTSLLFLALVTLIWVVELAFHSLHSVYAFSDDMFRMLRRLEILLAYADAAASAGIVLNSLGRHFLEFIRGEA